MIKKPAHPKPGKRKKVPKDTPETIAHKNWVASQLCMIPRCLDRSSVHHIRINGEPKDHFKTIPLCHEHHQGDTGIHGMGKHAWRKIYGHELDMLEELMRKK